MSGPGDAPRTAGGVERVWTVRDALDWTVGHFERSGVERPRLSAEWLLSAATGLSRVELYAFFDRPLSPEERVTLRQSVKRRAAGEPLQYVTGEMPFRHLVLRVRPGVFIPRPETEVLVDAALEALGAALQESPLVIDLCTGSGAVAVSIAHEVPGARVHATDLNPAAVALARENAERAGVADRVTVVEGDLFAPVPRELRGQVTLVVANPPYVPSGDLPDLPAEVLGFEPRLALDGGPDGLDVARRIMRDARDWLAPSCVLSMELDTTRASDAAQALREWYEGVRTVRDLTGRERVVTGRTQEA